MDKDDNDDDNSLSNDEQSVELEGEGSHTSSRSSSTRSRSKSRNNSVSKIKSRSRSNSQSSESSDSNESKSGSSTSSSSSSSSSSESENEIADPKQAADMRLQQMKRQAATKKDGKSKLLERFKGLKSVEQIQQEHMMERINKGLRTLLGLHVPQELSSIVGVIAGEEGVLNVAESVMNAQKVLAPLKKKTASASVDLSSAPTHRPMQSIVIVAPVSKKAERPKPVLIVQQTGPKSIEMLMKWYLGDTKDPLYFSTKESDLRDRRLTRLLDIMWEGAIFEYLRHIGHPVRSIFADPRATVKLIWEKGGIVDASNTTFTPHFIVREVKKRYEWISSDDVKRKLDDLYIAQSKAKVAEREIISHHDYNNILAYFRHMKDLRNQENKLRDYILSEMETVRSRLDMMVDSNKMLTEQLGEIEVQFEKTVTILNTEYAYQESISDELTRLKVRDAADMARLGNIIDSWTKYETHRETKRLSTEVEAIGPDVKSKDKAAAIAAAYAKAERAKAFNELQLEVLKLEKEDECSLPIRYIHTKFRRYKDMRDRFDVRLRRRCCEQKKSKEELERKVLELELQLKESNDTNKRIQAQSDMYWKELQVMARKWSSNQVHSKTTKNEAWSMSLDYLTELSEYRDKVKLVRDSMMMGLRMENNPLLNKVCHNMIKVFNMFSEEEISMNQELAMMYVEDKRSLLVKAFEDEIIAKSKRKAAVKKPMRVTGPSISRAAVENNTATDTSVSGFGSDSESEMSAKGKTASPSGKRKKGGSSKPSSAAGGTKPSSAMKSPPPTASKAKPGSSASKSKPPATPSKPGTSGKATAGPKNASPPPAAKKSAPAKNASPAPAVKASKGGKTAAASPPPAKASKGGTSSANGSKKVVDADDNSVGSDSKKSVGKLTKKRSSNNGDKEVSGIASTTLTSVIPVEIVASNSTMNLNPDESSVSLHNTMNELATSHSYSNLFHESSVKLSIASNDNVLDETMLGDVNNPDGGFTSEFQSPEKRGSELGTPTFFSDEENIDDM